MGHPTPQPNSHDACQDLRGLGDGRDHWGGAVEERVARHGLRHQRRPPSSRQFEVS